MGRAVCLSLYSRYILLHCMAILLSFTSPQHISRCSLQPQSSKWIVLLNCQTGLRCPIVLFHIKVLFRLHSEQLKRLVYFSFLVASDLFVWTVRLCEFVQTADLHETIAIAIIARKEFAHKLAKIRSILLEECPQCFSFRFLCWKSWEASNFNTTVRMSCGGKSRYAFLTGDEQSSSGSDWSDDCIYKWENSSDQSG